MRPADSSPDSRRAEFVAIVVGLDSSEGDPIFAAINAHKIARLRRDAICEPFHALPIVRQLRALKELSEAVEAAEKHATKELLTTVPLTLRGMRAFLKYLATNGLLPPYGAILLQSPVLAG
jgi:hypothetical protein